MGKKVKFILQQNSMDCGPTCLAMICQFHGKKIPLDFLRKNTFITREGVSMLGISQAAISIGFEAIAGQLSVDILKSQNSLPCILFWGKDHFVVFNGISKKRFSNEFGFEVIDPSVGKIILTEQEFNLAWLNNKGDGIALFLKPTDVFFNTEFPIESKISTDFIVKHLFPHKKKFFIMFFLLLLGSCATLVFPFLTQSLIDKGVSNKDISYIQSLLSDKNTN